MTDLEDTLGPSRSVGRLVERLHRQEMKIICDKGPKSRAARYLLADFPNIGANKECMHQDVPLAMGASILARLMMICFWIGSL